jgi:hypothetical protein
VARPTLLPGLRRLWRDRHAVQLGTDPRRAVVLEFADPALARVLDLLDGSRTDEAVRREAARLGVPQPATEALLDTLRERGLTLDAATLVPAGVPEPARRWLANEVAALALAGHANPAAVIRRRTAARVLVTGYGRLAVPIAAGLAGAGVGHVDPAITGRTRSEDTVFGGLLPADTGRPRATVAADAVLRVAPTASIRPLRDGTATFVVLVGSSRPASLTALTYARLALPHLAVDVRDGIVVVGPLVPPTGSPCLNCIDLHRRDRDPAWPALVAQLATGPESPAPVAVTTLLTATGYAVDAVLGYLDGGEPAAAGTTIEISGPGREQRRTWTAHPRCGCGRRRLPRASQRHEVQ